VDRVVGEAAPSCSLSVVETHYGGELLLHIRSLTREVEWVLYRTGGFKPRSVEETAVRSMIRPP
jgi:hypothetical protein